jgi:hypothetical protein
MVSNAKFETDNLIWNKQLQNLAMQSYRCHDPTNITLEEKHVEMLEKD